MTFDEVLAQVLELLRLEGRVAYRILKRRFELSDDDLEDLKADLIDAKRVAVDEDGKVLVWTGSAAQSPDFRTSDYGPRTPNSQTPGAKLQGLAPRLPQGDRRQLTVMFCDLVGSTALSGQLDPEDLRDVVRAYQETAATVITRYEGHIAQYLGDGLLVYFGYPHAHEDDARRAVWTGVEIIEAMGALNTRMEPTKGVRLAVRLGIHTGLVVVGC